MISDFNSARKTLRTSNSQLNIISVNGCCYGQDKKPDKNGVYFKYCGQVFWEFISGDKDLYTKLIEPLAHEAKKRNDSYLKSYYRIINRFTLEFAKEYCDENGDINWKKLVKFNSSKE